MQHRDVRNPRGPADGITVSAPIPGEVQCSAPAGSVFIQDTRTCEPAAPLRLLLFVAVMNFFSTVFTLCLHVVVVSLNLSGALDDWCVCRAQLTVLVAGPTNCDGLSPSALVAEYPGVRKDSGRLPNARSVRGLPIIILATDPCCIGIL